MTTSVKKAISELNQAVKAIGSLNDQLNQVMSNREYNKVMADKVDVLRLAKSLAEIIESGLSTSIELEAECGGHIGTTKTLSEIEREYILNK